MERSIEMGNQEEHEEETNHEKVIAKEMLKNFSLFEIGAMVEGLQRTNNAIKEDLEEDPADTHGKNKHKETLSNLEEKLFKIYQAAREIKDE